MRRVGPVIVVALVGLLAGAAVATVVLIPRWELRTLPVGTRGESIQSIAWSLDGTRFLTQENGRYSVIRASDAAVLLAVDGYSPVWIDDRTIDSLREIGGMRTELVRLDLRADYPSPIGQPLGIARLVADRGGHLAARSLIGEVVTNVIDPTDGQVIAVLPGLRAQVWAGSGTLVSKTEDPQRQAQGVLPGSLVAWSAARGTWPIGAGQLEFLDSLAISPSGDMVACVCGLAGDRSGGTPPLAITVVPIDGSPARVLAPFESGNPVADPAVIWLDDRTLAFADKSGLHRLGMDGRLEGIAGFDPSELSTSGSLARIAKIGDALLVVTLHGSGPTGIAGLTLIEPNGFTAFRSTFPSWNLPFVVPDSNRRRVLIISDPQVPGEPPNEVRLLGQGTLPQPSQLEPLEPSPTPLPTPGPSRIERTAMTTPAQRFAGSARIAAAY